MRSTLMVSLSVALSVFLIMGTLPASAKTVFVSVGGGPTGGTFNYFANGISLWVPKVVKDVRMSAEGSGGSVENVRRVNNGDFDLGISYAVDIGLGAVGKLPKDETKYDKVRCIGYLYGAPAQLVVQKDTPYNSAKDLVGKKVAVGNAGSGAATSAERFFRHLGIWDKFSPQFLGYSAAASAFKDGKIDAFWVLVGYPNASVIEAATQTPIRLIDVGVDAEESGFYGEYAYAATVIPAGTYPGQDKECKSFQDSTFLTSRSDVPEELIYEVTKAVWSEKGLESMRQAHKAAKNMSMEHNFMNASRPLHKGAYKFWMEKGIEVPDKLKPID